MSMARSSKDYEREANETRMRLSSTLDELADNLTPGRVLDEVMSYARSGGGNFLRGLGNATASNPLPTLLIGVGCAMLLTGRGRIEDVQSMFGRGDGHRREPSDWPERSSPYATARVPRPDGNGYRHGGMGEAVGSAMAGASGAIGSAGANARDAASSATSAVADAADRARRGVASSMSDAADVARQGLDTATGTVRSAATTGANAASDAASSAAAMAASAASQVSDAAASASAAAADMASSLAEQAGELSSETTRMAQEWAARANQFAREQPLLMAAGGLVVGAALAAILPRTQMEDSLLGKTGHDIRKAAGEVASEQMEKAKAAAGKVVEAARSTAEEEGLHPGMASEAIRDLGEKIGNVVTAGAEAASEELGDGASTDRYRPSGSSQGTGIRPSQAGQSSTPGSSGATASRGPGQGGSPGSGQMGSSSTGSPMRSAYPGSSQMAGGTDRGPAQPMRDKENPLSDRGRSGGSSGGGGSPGTGSKDKI